MSRENDFPITYGVITKTNKLAELELQLSETKKTLARKETLLAELNRAVYSLRGAVARQQDAINRLRGEH